VKIEFASRQDYNYLADNDRHIRPEELNNKIMREEIIVIGNNMGLFGWLRYGYFWDAIPFMNLIYIEEDYRRKGFGTRLIEFWEDEMRKKEYNKVMTSTMSNEQAQHFYRRQGYRDCGALLLPNEPLEILFLKILD